MTRLILTLGMHRSGTSLVARSLECLGAELGPDAFWSGPDNPDFAEDKHLLALNEALLQAHGATWHTLPLPDLAHPQITAFAEDVLRHKLGRFPIFAWKDPRLCRLLPFWRPILERVGCRVSVVHVIRHPMAVARSLHRRNGLTIQHGLSLWLDHVAHQFADEDLAWRSAVVSYDAMLLLPHATLGEIAKSLALPTDHNAMARFARDNVRRDLCHEHARIGDELPPEVDDLWRRVMVKGDVL